MNKKILGGIVILVVIIFGIYLYTSGDNSQDMMEDDSKIVENNDDSMMEETNKNSNNNSNEATPVKHDDEDKEYIDYSEDGKIRAEFSSPEEVEFLKGQARMWKVEITNSDEESSGLSYECDWTYTLEGIEYEKGSGKDSCAFTSTFIEDPGSLIVDVKINILQGRSVFDENDEYVDYVKDVVESLNVQRQYVVTSPVDTYIHP